MPRRVRDTPVTHDIIFTIQSGISQSELNNILDTARDSSADLSFKRTSRGMSVFARFSSEETLKEFEDIISPNPRILINKSIISDPTASSPISELSAINFIINKSLSEVSDDPIDDVDNLVRELNGKVNFQESDDGNIILGTAEFSRVTALDEFKKKVIFLGVKLIKATEMRGVR